eukprot:12060438-Prorocentrum_lima.AAC.1
MTSSLVGSEMCIRDSVPTVEQAPPRPPDEPVEIVDRRVALHTHMAEAVSYTHLTLPTICSV